MQNFWNRSMGHSGLAVTASPCHLLAPPGPWEPREGLVLMIVHFFTIKISSPSLKSYRAEQQALSHCCASQLCLPLSCRMSMTQGKNGILSSVLPPWDSLLLSGRTGQDIDVTLQCRGVWVLMISAPRCCCFISSESSWEDLRCCCFISSESSWEPPTSPELGWQRHFQFYNNTQEIHPDLMCHKTGKKQIKNLR